MAVLRYEHPSGRTLWVELDPEVVVIGRGKECELQVLDGLASRRHCELRKQPGGGHILVDLKSKNGTYANGVPVNKWTLSDGDLITIGNSSIVYKLRK